MKAQTVCTVAGFALTQIAVAGAVVLPLAAHAQGRPNFEETLPPVPGKENYAQSLVDRISAAHPELIQLDIHAVAPGTQQSAIVAAMSAVRVGKPSDADDIEVARSGDPRVEINRTGNNNVEVELPLLSVTKQTVGTVEMTFPYVAGTDRNALVQKALGIANEMRRRIAHGPEDLVTPAQYDGVAPDTYAQYLIDDTLDREPGVAILVLHARDAQGGFPILASNIGRIGKPADASDLGVIREGEEVRAASADGLRYEVKMPMRNAKGDVVGALAVVFPRRISTEEALAAAAHRIRDHLGTRITSAENLMGPYPRIARQPVDKVQTPYEKQELGNTQSLPMTKAVIAGAALEQTSQEGYAEAMRNVAGVSPANSKGSANDSLLIRGIKLNLFANFRLNGGLPIAGVQTQPSDDKERVEALKGANALMFGVASPAGIINFVTKRAGPIDVTSVGVAGNSFGQSGISVDLGRRFGAERQLGIRVNASNTHLENGVVGGTGKFYSAALDYQITNRLSIQGDYELYTRNVLVQGGISLLAPVHGVIPITPVPDPRKLLTGPWAIFDARTENKQLRADYVINDWWKILAEIGRSDSKRNNFTPRIGNYDVVTGANGIVTVNTADQVFQNNFGRTEALGRFSTWMLSHSLTVGLSQTERIANNVAQNQTTLQQRQNIYNPVELPAPVFTKPPTSSRQTSKDTAAYTYDTIGIGPRFKLLAGFRHTKDVETSNTSSNTTNVDSPAYGALYDIIPSVTVFASYMEGLEAGGIAPATAINTNEILPSAVSKQKELGIRDSHIRGLSLSASYFEIERANAVTDPVTRIFANNGDINYKGLESTLSWQFLPRWTLRGGIQFLKARQVTPDPTFNGFWPENTPRRAGNASVSYRVTRVPGLTVTGGVSGISARYVNNQQQATIPGYALYSVGAGYVTRIGGKRTSFQVNVDNVANRRYWNSVQTGTYGTGTDRSIKFNARVEF
ncbi:MAG TPA: TonB-dependent receptor [Usitatibacter sp.]|jgi:iron complex outermembrane receptor protein|nr:TonB-dependent receptor [Usitatibacter sp.]